MKKPTILILHGWGASSKSFQEVKELLENEGFSVEVPDLPGFGRNPLAKENLSFDDYLAFVKNVIGKRKVILIGHSFGGRIAIRFTRLYPDSVEKLVLTASSGIARPLPSLRKKAAYGLTALVSPFAPLIEETMLFKSLRKLMYYAIGEMDYYKAAGLTDTFKNIYGVSIIDDLAYITIPTFIIWGEEDKVTPLIDGEVMHKNIKNSRLVVVKGAGHKFLYEMPHVFVDKILPFLQ